MQYDRRKFLVAGAAASVASLSLPGWVTAASAWPGTVFSRTELEAALHDLLQGQAPVEGKVSLTVPSIAESGSQVRVSVNTDLSKVEVISLLVEKNPVPLTSQFIMAEASRPEIAVNLKVRGTSRIIALVKADGRFYSASREVRVTAGGCA